jgi:hypothetical protein
MHGKRVRACAKSIKDILLSIVYCRKEFYTPNVKGQAPQLWPVGGNFVWPISHGSHLRLFKLLLK